MNIKQRRLQNLIEQIIQEELQKGNLPTSREFIRRMQDGLYRNDLSKPSLNATTVRAGANAFAEDVNKLIDQGEGDLSILYKSIVDKYDKSLKNFNKFDVDKSRLDYELNKIENQLKELILLHKESGFLRSVYDVFDDLSKIDTGKSTVEVDIKAHQVSLARSKNNSQKISTEDSIATFSLDEKTKKEAVHRITTGDPKKGLTDAIDEFWSEMIYLSGSSNQVVGTYEVNFSRVEICNHIEMELHTGKEIEMELEYTENGVTWQAVPSIEKKKKSSGSVSFYFEFVAMSGLRIKMKKKESDHSTNMKTSTSQSVVYGYLLGIRKLALFQTKFSEVGELHSKVLSPEDLGAKPFSINKVSLLTDEALPNGTNIDYYIAMVPQKDELPEWKAISPVNHDAAKHDQIIDFKTIAQAPAESYRMDPNISESEYRLESLYANGIHFYKLADLDNIKIIEGTESLYLGKDSWSVKSYERDWGVSYLPKLEDWEQENNTIKESFQPVLAEKSGVLLEKVKLTKKTNYMFTLGVFSRKEEETVSSIPVSNEPIAIYMNGEKVFEGIPKIGAKVNYVFKSGWNEIKVLMYVENTVGSTTGTSLSIGFDPRLYGSYSYARMRSLEKVSLFDLRYNTKSNDSSRYAIMETNGRYTIVLNKFIPGLTYDFYFDHIDGVANTEILLKAVMSYNKAATTLSPKLKSYRLRFS